MDYYEQYRPKTFDDVTTTKPGEEKLFEDEETPAVYLMVPDIQIDWPDEEYYVTWDGQTSEELGGKVIEIMKVNDVLKRWSEEDGFYHAQEPRLRLSFLTLAG